ncbi:MAG: SagB/ThcOx family dehydrogenase [Anaerolineae bacterium]|nr:SagB/ThcOx family dehydrogenase [Anaerolineae bacterium]
MAEGIGKTFMQQTRYEFMGPTDQQRGLPHPFPQLDYDESLPLIALPKAEAITAPALDLRAAIEGRRTRRKYAPTPLSLDELAFLLWSAQGVQGRQGPTTLRTVPSAGARHAFETVLLVNNISGLEPGLYRYLALEHALLHLPHEAEINAQITRASMDQNQVRTSAVTFIWMAVRYRMAYRYGERGYRYLHLDAGHVCQNLYLAAEAVGCGVCAIAAFDDALLNEAIGADGEEQFAIYVATVGKQP